MLLWAHSWNHKLRNFISSPGHVISSLYIYCYILILSLLQTTTPRTLQLTTQVTPTSVRQATIRVNQITGNPTTTNSSFSEVTMIPSYTMWTPEVIWKPAVIECKHIFSTYVVTNVFHFLAFFTGFYLFRIQESEGLNALIEKARIISCYVWQMPCLLCDYL